MKQETSELVSITARIIRFPPCASTATTVVRHTLCKGETSDGSDSIRAGSFAAFHQEFAPLFGRTEAQRRSEQDVRGLLVQQTDRRNAENVAEMIEGATPRTLQRLLTEAPWATEWTCSHDRCHFWEAVGPHAHLHMLWCLRLAHHNI